MSCIGAFYLVTVTVRSFIHKYSSHRVLLTPSSTLSISLPSRISCFMSSSFPFVHFYCFIIVFSYFSWLFFFILSNISPSYSSILIFVGFNCSDLAQWLLSFCLINATCWVSVLSLLDNIANCRQSFIVYNGFFPSTRSQVLYAPSYSLPSCLCVYCSLSLSPSLHSSSFI